MHMTKIYRHGSMDWHSDSFLLPKELGRYEGRNNIRKLIATDTDELHQYCYNGSFTYLDRLSFRVKI